MGKPSFGFPKLKSPVRVCNLRMKTGLREGVDRIVSEVDDIHFL